MVRPMKSNSSKLKSKPLNSSLYRQVVQEAKSKFLVWPSAYASGWVVNTYKKRGGTYAPAPLESSAPLTRWYQEKWVDVCEYLKTGQKQPCGRKKAVWDQNYPYCRPDKRISSHTPMTLEELLHTQGIAEIKRRCQRKRQTPTQRISASP